MLSVPPLHIGMAYGAGGKTQRTARDRHLAQIEGGALGRNAPAHHHGSDFRCADHGVRGQGPWHQRGKAVRSGPGQKAHPDVAIRRG